jgi:hypothetical protein
MTRPSPKNVIAFALGLVMGASGLTHVVYWILIGLLLFFGRHPIVLSR